MLLASPAAPATAAPDRDTYARLARFQVTDGVTTIFDIRRGTADVDAWYTEHRGKMPIRYGVGIGFRDVRHQVMEPTPPYETDTPADERELAEILAGIEHGLERGAVAVGMGVGSQPYLHWEAAGFLTFGLAMGAVAGRISARALSSSLAVAASNDEDEP